MAPKTARRQKKDRLSSLPDCVLLHILSFLDMRDVVRTGILSNRWRNLWNYIPNLQFSEGFVPSDIFVSFVDRTLVCHRASKIHKFQLRWTSSDVDVWIRFAVNKGVEELDLEFYLSSFSVSNFYSLPCWLFKCETLVSLKLTRCRIDVPQFVRFISLAELSLSYIHLTDKMLQDLLAACPLLEDLDVNTISTTSLCISSSSNSRLKHLKVYGTDLVNIEVDAPNLQILKLSGLVDGYCSFKDMASLVQAKLDLKPFRYWSKPSNLSKPSILKSWVHNLGHAKVLELSGYCIQEMPTPTFTNPHSYIFKTKCLTLHTVLQRTQLPKIASLLWISPHLETLIMTMDFLHGFHVVADPEEYGTNVDSDQEYWESLRVSFPCFVNHLKNVKISIRSYLEINNVDNLINLVRFLLRNAMVLEKMTICVQEKPGRVNVENWQKTLLMVTQKLLAIPRASSCAKLLFSYE